MLVVSVIGLNKVSLAAEKSQAKFRGSSRCLEMRPRHGNWEYYVQGDVGGGNTVDSAWQVALGTAYHYSEMYAFSAGYRYLDIDHDDNNFVFDGNLEGILIGLMFKI